MRAEKSVKNVIVSWGIQLVVSLCGFIMRMIFVRTLNKEYLGLSSLFANILTVLSLAELGVGSAITFSLYKPIADNDTDQIAALMQFFKKFYRFVGFTVLAFGTILTPFLPYLVNEMPQNVDHIYVIFIMYVVNSGISYFYSYKTTFVNANQDYYIYSLNHGICYSTMIVIQIIILLTTKNFLIYFGVQIIATFVENYSISKIADSKYHVLKEKNRKKIPKDTMHNIKVNTIAMIGHNIGGIVLGATDNIIISKFIGVIEVGIYSNYLLITSTVNTFLQQAFTSIVSSIGNLIVEGSEDEKENTFYMIFFANFWLYAFSGIAIYCLATPFIVFVFGKEYQFNQDIIAIMVMSFYATGIRQTVLSFRNAYGLFMQDVYKSYIEAIVNLIISIILVKKLGIFGVFVGTVASIFGVAIWMETLILFKYGFKKSPFKYYFKFIIYLFLFIVFAFFTEKIANMIAIKGIFGFIIKMIIVGIIPNLLICICFFKTKEFRSLINTLIAVRKTNVKN